MCVASFFVPASFYVFQGMCQADQNSKKTIHINVIKSSCLFFYGAFIGAL